MYVLGEKWKWLKHAAVSRLRLTWEICGQEPSNSETTKADKRSQRPHQIQSGSNKMFEAVRMGSNGFEEAQKVWRVKAHLNNSKSIGYAAPMSIADNSF